MWAQIPASPRNLWFPFFTNVIEVLLIYSVMLISSLQQCDSVIFFFYCVVDLQMCSFHAVSLEAALELTVTSGGREG